MFVFVSHLKALCTQHHIRPSHGRVPQEVSGTGPVLWWDAPHMWLNSCAVCHIVTVFVWQTCTWWCLGQSNGWSPWPQQGPASTRSTWRPPPTRVTSSRRLKRVAWRWGATNGYNMFTDMTEKAFWVYANYCHLEWMKLWQHNVHMPLMENSRTLQS